MIRCILAICGLIAADQAVKWYTVSHLTLGETAPLLPGLVELLRVHNYGAAWSSFSGMRWLLIVVTAAVMAVLAVLLLRRMVRHPLGVTALVLILSGGVGNLIRPDPPGLCGWTCSISSSGPPTLCSMWRTSLWLLV